MEASEAVQLQFEDGVGLHCIERAKVSVVGTSPLSAAALPALPSATFTVLPVK